MTLVIEPNETLQFYGPPNEKLSSTLTLKNRDRSKTLAVRLMTNAPRSISVKPKIALVKAKEAIAITLTLKPYNLNAREIASIKVLSCAWAGNFVYNDELFDILWSQAESFKQIENRFINVAYLSLAKSVSFAPKVAIIDEGGHQGDGLLKMEVTTAEEEQLAIPANETQGEDDQGNENWGNEGVEEQAPNAAAEAEPANEPDNWVGGNVDEEWGGGGGGVGLNEQQHEVGAPQVEGQDVNNNQDVDENNNQAAVEAHQGLNQDWGEAPAEQNNQAQVAVNHPSNEEMASNAPENQWDYQGGQDAWGQDDNAAAAVAFNENDPQEAAQQPWNQSYRVEAVEYLVNPLTEAFFVIFVTFFLGILVGKTA